MNELTQYLVSQAGLVLFVVVFAEQIGLPMVTAPLLVVAGGLAADGELSLGLALGATLVACVAADTIWFYLGWWGGDRLLRWLWRMGHGSIATFERTEQMFARYGMSAVAAAKFVPGFGLLIPPLAGAFRVGIGRFLWFDALGSLLYGLVYMGLGFVFDDQVDGTLELLNEYGLSFVAALALGALVAWLGWKYVARRPKQQMAPLTVPISVRG